MYVLNLEVDDGIYVAKADGNVFNYPSTKVDGNRL